MNILRAIVVCLLLGGSIGSAQQFPAKSIRFVVPFPAGGGVDALARLLGQKLTEAWGQQVIVENRPGAQGSIGNALAAKAAPDGYTILVSECGSLCVNPHLYTNVGFNPQKDFAPVTLAIQQPSVLVAHPSVPAKSIKELIALAKAKPGKLTIGTSSAAPQIAGELFQIMAGIKLTHVPYKGTNPALIDVLGGHVDLIISGPSAPLPFIRSGRLRALAVTTRTRVDILPEVPAVSEAGIPEYEMFNWMGVLAPAGTPAEILSRLNTELVRILKLPEVRERLIRDGMQPVGNSSEEFAAFMRSEIVKWGKAVQLTGVRVN
ncbi:MAG: tripartite tricarboxylate transporter substrate binding protein [Betaproteobacteria bacterium]|nr:tripartite tricarboxylate transporter substrate binding protein [Betaproteobacteria bacterium]